MSKSPVVQEPKESSPQEDNSGGGSSNWDGNDEVSSRNTGGEQRNKNQPSLVVHTKVWSIHSSGELHQCLGDLIFNSYVWYPVHMKLLKARAPMEGGKEVGRPNMSDYFK